MNRQVCLKVEMCYCKLSYTCSMYCNWYCKNYCLHDNIIPAGSFCSSLLQLLCTLVHKVVANQPLFAKLDCNVLQQIVLVGWLLWTIKHINKLLFTSNCHFNAIFRPSRASLSIQQSMQSTQCHVQVTNQMPYTIYSSRCLIREFQTGLREDSESMLYVVVYHSFFSHLECCEMKSHFVGVLDCPK